MTRWYTHLIEIESVTEELDKMDLSAEEKLHLAHLVDSSLHHTILDAVLSQLSNEDKEVFLRHLEGKNHDQIWQFLNDKVQDIEEKIQNTAEEFKKILKKDLKEAKTRV